MADMIGIGLSHFPGPVVPVECWPQLLRTNVEKGRIPRELFADRGKWPKEMVDEWGADEGQSAARNHQARLLSGYREVRKRLDAFQPDIVLIWGDDQYENFRMDGVPAFCVYIFDELVSKPLAGGLRGPFKTDRNAWGLPAESELITRGHPEAAQGLIRSLFEQDFDPSYAFDVRFERGLSHAFANTVLFLDYDRQGFAYPIIPFHVNCFGSQMLTAAARRPMMCPPSPSPKRCFEIGAAVARYFRNSPWRVALVGSSSWSHGSLTRKHQRLYPDMDADRKRYSDLKSGHFSDWQKISLEEIEDTGQSEFLNWICLAGAMAELDYEPEVIDYIESYIFNSSKCFAVFSPHHSRSSRMARAIRLLREIDTRPWHDRATNRLIN